jgi:hypothetical protein
LIEHFKKSSKSKMNKRGRFFFVHFWLLLGWCVAWVMLCDGLAGVMGGGWGNYYKKRKKCEQFRKYPLPI